MLLRILYFLVTHEPHLAHGRKALMVERHYIAVTCCIVHLEPKPLAVFFLRML